MQSTNIEQNYVNNINFIREKISNCMPHIIEAFVQFYGEENREFIKNKLNNILVIPFVNYNYYESYISNYENDLFTIFCDKLGIPENDNLNFIFPFFNSGINKFENIENYLKLEKIEEKKIKDNMLKFSASEFLKYFFPELDTSPYKVIKDDYFEKIRKSYNFNKVNKFIESYKKFKEDYINPLLSEKDFVKKQKKEISDNLYENYLLQFKDLKMINEIKNITNLPENIIFEIFFGTESKEPIIFAFSKESDLLLNTGDEWQKTSILEDRKNVLDLLSKYDNGMNNISVEKLKSEILKSNKIEFIRSKYNEYRRQLEIRLTFLNYQFNEIKKQIIGHNLTAPFLIDNLYGFAGAVLPAVNDLGETFPILYIDIPLNKDFNKFDSTLIHELNHVIELCIKQCNKNCLKCISGWDITEISKDKNVSISKNSSINEITNDLIAERVTKIMHSHDCYILSDSKNTIYTSSTYGKLKNLIIPFLKQFEDVVIESRRNNNMKLLINTVGIENFNEFSRLCDEYDEYFFGLSDKEMYNELYENKNPKIIEQNSIFVDRRDVLLKKMINHYNETMKK